MTDGNQGDLSDDVWYMGISVCTGPNILTSANEAQMEKLLTSRGCADIELMGTGAAQARVPVEWLAGLQGELGYSQVKVLLDDTAYVIDIDLP